jgi:hypothetical protein
MKKMGIGWLFPAMLLAGFIIMLLAIALKR